MRSAFVILALLPLIGCKDDHGRRSTVITPDTRPSFFIDPSKPFQIQLGRGSGWHGIEIVSIDQNGVARVDRQEPNVAFASIQLSPSQLKQITDDLNARHLVSMGSSYSDPQISDGTQWILWISQPPLEKSIYCNNAFPPEITGFAGTLDGLLNSAGLKQATWTPISSELNRDRQKALWARIR